MFPTKHFGFQNINWEQSLQITYQISLVIISNCLKVSLTKFELPLYFGLGFLM